MRSSVALAVGGPEDHHGPPREAAPARGTDAAVPASVRPVGHEVLDRP